MLVTAFKDTILAGEELGKIYDIISCPAQQRKCSLLTMNNFDRVRGNDPTEWDWEAAADVQAAGQVEPVHLAADDRDDDVDRYILLLMIVMTMLDVCIFYPRII